MKRILMVGLLVLIFGGICCAQSQERSKADSLREEGKLELAIKEYKSLYLEDPENKYNTYNFACALALDKQVDTAFHYLNISVLSDTTIRPLSDPDFYFLIEDERWSDVENSLIEKVEVKFGEYENLELSKELWSMKLKDQAFYYHIDITEKSLGRNSPVSHGLWELKDLIDHKNIKRIEEIIDEHGWPKKSVVKGSAAGAVFVIIQHADIDVQKKYMPLMREAANNNEAAWSSLALLIDRVNLREGKRQIYGSQIGKDKVSGTRYVSPLEDPQNVNIRRKEVGLEPIEDYIKFWNMEWDVKKHIENTKKIESLKNS